MRARHRREPGGVASETTTRRKERGKRGSALRVGVRHGKPRRVPHRRAFLRAVARFPNLPKCSLLTLSQVILRGDGAQIERLAGIGRRFDSIWTPDPGPGEGRGAQGKEAGSDAEACRAETRGARLRSERPGVQATDSGCIAEDSAVANRGGSMQFSRHSPVSKISCGTLGTPVSFRCICPINISTAKPPILSGS